MSEETKTEVKYSSYTPAQKKASQQYRLNNKDKINIQRKKYYQNRKLNDPTFLEYKRIKAREYYEKKKLDKVVKTEPKPEEPKMTEPESIVEEVKQEEVKPQPEIKEAVELAPIPDAEPTKKKKSKKEKKQ
jgi:hypothetical protein